MRASRRPEALSPSVVFHHTPNGLRRRREEPDAERGENCLLRFAARHESDGGKGATEEEERRTESVLGLRRRFTTERTEREKRNRRPMRRETRARNLDNAESARQRGRKEAVTPLLTRTGALSLSESKKSTVKL